MLPKPAARRRGDAGPGRDFDGVAGGTGERRPKDVALAWGGSGGRADHAPDLIGRIILPADREQSRRGGEIDRVDHALDFRRDGDVLTCRVLAGRGQLVGAGWPLRAVIALAVPNETAIALVQRKVAGIDGLSARIGDRDRGGRILRSFQIPGRRTVELLGAAVDG